MRSPHSYEVAIHDTWIVCLNGLSLVKWHRPSLWCHYITGVNDIYSKSSLSCLAAHLMNLDHLAVLRESSANKPCHKSIFPLHEKEERELCCKSDCRRSASSLSWENYCNAQFLYLCVFKILSHTWNIFLNDLFPHYYISYPNHRNLDKSTLQPLLEGHM